MGVDSGMRNITVKMITFEFFYKHLALFQTCTKHPVL